MKEIVVKIKPDGKVMVETNGFVGNECLLASKEIEEMLGIVKKEKKKPEFYIKNKQSIKMRGF
jgi:fructose-specific phosphotransferase system component IIB